MKNENDLLQRRRMLQGAAVFGAASVAAACGTATPDPVVPPKVDNAKEFAQLNALLTAEYKAIDAYTQGAGVLTAEKTGGATQADRDLASLVLAVAGAFIQDHEDHAALLDKTIRDLSGTPVTKADAKFTLPAGFKASTVNVMKLACNEERRAAIAYNQVLAELQTGNNRFIAAAIEGDETQHFIVLSALIEGLVAPTAELTPNKNADQVVPRAFVSSTESLGGKAGLQSEPDLAVNDNA